MPRIKDISYLLTQGYILTIYTRNYFIWISWIYRLLYLQHLYHLQLLSTFRIKVLGLSET